MRFLVDNAISQIVSMALVQAGHDSVHVRELGLQAAEDAPILDRASADERTLVSADTDFAAILAHRGTRRPSIIQFRHGAEHRPQLQIALLLDNLPALVDAIREGAIVTIEPSRIRIRRLPIA